MSTVYFHVLAWLAAAAAVLALIAFMIGNTETTEAATALGALGLSSIALTVAIVSGVGALVLAGVIDLMRKITAEIKVERTDA